MKRARRMLAVLMIAVLCCTGFAFAAAAAIVSPAQNTIVYSDSLLISVKVTEPKTVQVALYEEKEKSGENLVSVDVSGFADTDLAAISNPADGVKKYTSVAIGEAATYKCETTLGFYTKQISDIKPGLYRVQVGTLHQDGSTSEVVQSYVAVKVKPVEEKIDLFKPTQTGALQFLQTLLKNIFR